MKGKNTGSSIPFSHQTVKFFQRAIPPMFRVTLILFPRPIHKTLSGMEGNIESTSPLDWAILWVIVSWASGQSIDFVSANLKVSQGSISKLMKTLLFFSFQVNYNIQTSWWSSCCWDPHQNRWSIFVKNEWVGKISNIQNMWSIVSSIALHRAHIYYINLGS